MRFVVRFRLRSIGIRTRLAFAPRREPITWGAAFDRDGAWAARHRVTVGQDAENERR